MQLTPYTDKQLVSDLFETSSKIVEIFNTSDRTIKLKNVDSSTTNTDADTLIPSPSPSQTTYTNSFVFDSTPSGMVIMSYDCDKSSFVYFANNNIHTKYLRAVAMKFMCNLNCKHLIYDVIEKERRTLEIIPVIKEKIKQKKEEKEMPAGKDGNPPSIAEKVQFAEEKKKNIEFMEKKQKIMQKSIQKYKKTSLSRQDKRDITAMSKDSQSAKESKEYHDAQNNLKPEKNEKNEKNEKRVKFHKDPREHALCLSKKDVGDITISDIEIKFMKKGMLADAQLLQRQTYKRAHISTAPPEEEVAPGNLVGAAQTLAPLPVEGTELKPRSWKQFKDLTRSQLTK